MTGDIGSDSARTILIADDDPDLLMLMTRRLSKAGYHVITASDGKQALDLAEQFLPQLAVLDVMMPKFSGIEVLVRLRADPATHDMLIMLISAGFPGGMDDAGSPARPDVFMRKPFRPSELGNRVAELFEQRRAS